MNPITLPNPQYPMLSARMETPFVQQLLDGPTMGVNNGEMKLAVWNLLVTHRDLKLWCNCGIKPHRRWKVSDVKNYFGIKGSKKTLLAQFEQLKAELMPETNTPEEVNQ